MGQNRKRALRIGGYLLLLLLVFGVGVAAGKLGIVEFITTLISGPQEEDPPLSFRSGTTVNGVDVGSLTLEQAVDAMNTAAAQRELFEVTFADETVTLDGAELGWCVADSMPLYKLLETQLLAAEEEEELTEAQLTLTVDEGSLYEYTRETLLASLSALDNLTAYADAETAAPYLSYDAELDAYQLLGGTSVSGTVDAAALTDAVLAALDAGETSLNVVEQGLYSGNNLLAEGKTAQAALERANATLDLELTYVFGLSDGSYSGSETVARWRLAEWLSVGEDGLTLSADESAVLDYCEALADAYSDTSAQSGAIFVTTGGEQIPVTAPVVDRQVDAAALCADLLSCIENLEGGERSALYRAGVSGVAGSTDLGGTYVEVDMDNQHLYLYVNGALLADDDICSGDVATGCETPTGLYTFLKKQTNRTLTGPTWSDFVYYWMPFYQDYGLHDATWRTYPDEFGGSVYLEGGSHGCINMPLDLAETVYNNIEVGTYIILYGGER